MNNNDKIFLPLTATLGFFTPRIRLLCRRIFLNENKKEVLILFFHFRKKIILTLTLLRQ